jgi:hypothetical protein
LWGTFAKIFCWEFLLGTFSVQINQKENASLQINENLHRAIVLLFQRKLIVKSGFLTGASVEAFPFENNPPLEYKYCKHLDFPVPVFGNETENYFVLISKFGKGNWFPKIISRKGSSEISSRKLVLGISGKSRTQVVQITSLSLALALSLSPSLSLSLSYSLSPFSLSPTLSHHWDSQNTS